MISLNRRILIVDDNIDIHNDFRKILGGTKKSGRSNLSAIEDQLFGSDEDNDLGTNPPELEVPQVEYEIDSAYQGLDAVELVEKAVVEGRPYALIFMDVRMPPGIDGIETISRIWQRFPNVEIIICTAYSDYSFEEILDKLGTTDRLLFLTKPFDSIAVKQMALSLTRKWSLHEEARRQVNLLQSEISQRKESEERLHFMIHNDSLTGLANRNQLQISLQEAIEQAKDQKTRFALFFVDLDRFREVIDTLGYQNGDRLIRKVADRLRATFQNIGTVFYHGDEEFAILVPHITSIANTEGLGHQIAEAFEPHFDLDGLNIEIRPNVGIVIYPDHGCNIDMLMRHADMSLVHAKKEQGIRFYRERMNSFTPQRLTLLTDLRRAITYNDLILYFQPIADLQNHSIIGMEALLRWPHAEHGFIPPGEFIPLAERCGLIRELTAWVLGEVPKQWEVLVDRGYDLFVSVNLTANDLQNPSLPEMVREIIGKTQMPFNRLRFEVSEKGVMQDPEQAISTMNRLVEMGIGMSIDNFGTGYSSLAYLKTLPTREIKIDQSFVGEMELHTHNLAIVKSMVDLGHNLGLKVLAEGVGSNYSYDTLTEIGCDYLQGTVINGPAPAGELLLWLEHSEWRISVLDGTLS